MNTNIDLSRRLWTEILKHFASHDSEWRKGKTLWVVIFSWSGREYSTISLIRSLFWDVLWQYHAQLLVWNFVSDFHLTMRFFENLILSELIFIIFNPSSTPPTLVLLIMSHPQIEVSTQGLESQLSSYHELFMIRILKFSALLNSGGPSSLTDLWRRKNYLFSLASWIQSLMNVLWMIHQFCIQLW